MPLVDSNVTPLTAPRVLVPSACWASMYLPIKAPAWMTVCMFELCWITLVRFWVDSRALN
jgi:hypothetical protein